MPHGAPPEEHSSLQEALSKLQKIALDDSKEAGAASDEKKESISNDTTGCVSRS